MDDWIQFCGICGNPFKNALEADMAPEGPDGNPVHYACKAELTNLAQDLEQQPPKP